MKHLKPTMADIWEDLTVAERQAAVEFIKGMDGDIDVDLCKLAFFTLERVLKLGFNMPPIKSYKPCSCEPCTKFGASAITLIEKINTVLGVQQDVAT